MCLAQPLILCGKYRHVQFKSFFTRSSLVFTSRILYWAGRLLHRLSTCLHGGDPVLAPALYLANLWSFECCYKWPPRGAELGVAYQSTKDKWYDPKTEEKKRKEKEYYNVLLKAKFSSETKSASNTYAILSN